MSYKGRTGVVYNLGTKIKGGGEGEVYEIQGKSNLVAKIYYDKKFISTAECSNPRNLIKEKIETMLDQPVDPFINGVLSIAWPQDLLYDSNGRFVGYTMPKVSSKYHIYSASRPRERQALFPNYTWKTGIIIAYNLTLAVKKIHESGAVIGDLNPNNIMLDSHGNVTLIDTDSFNITNVKTGKTYKCSVGVPEMLAPELQGKDLSKTTSVFTKETDSFALSIHIFNLLMNNCHPFGCVGMNKSQSSSSSNPVVSNIVKGKCPYVSMGSGDRSPEAPDMMILPTDIRGLFDRVFSYNVTNAVKQDTIKKRPSASEWQQSLWKLYQVKFWSCSVNKSHLYTKDYGRCPWCNLNKPPVKFQNNTVTSSNTTRNNNTANSYGSSNTVNNIYSKSSTLTIRRNPTLLYVVCSVVGLVSSPFMEEMLVYASDAAFDYSISDGFGYIVLAILGIISGLTIAYFASEKYKTAYNGWPWLLIGLLTPLVTALIVAAIMLVIGIVIIVFQIVVALLVLACLCGLASGG